MSAAANLRAAAIQSSVDLTTLYYASTITVDFKAYWQAINTSGLFDNQTDNDHPILNWIAIIAAISTVGFAGADAVEVLQEAIAATYRLNYVSSVLNDNNLISTAQATALLAAYNANIAAP